MLRLIEKFGRARSGKFFHYDGSEYYLVGPGFVGAALLSEALSRGHEVTAIARHPEKLEGQENLAVRNHAGNEDHIRGQRG